MGVISRMFQPLAAITTSEGLWKELATYAGYGISGSGMAITPQTALGISAAYACRQVIAQTTGQIPCYLYKKEGTGKRKAEEHSLFTIIGARPNSFNNAMSFKEMLTGHTCFGGNSFAFINRVGNGRIYELLPLDPSTVGIYRDPWTWEVTYSVSQKKGINGIYTPKEIFHLMGMTLDGYRGVSPITFARESLGLSASAEKFGAKSFKQGAKPSGVFSAAKKLGDDAFERLKKELNEGFSGDNANNAMILENGDTWTPSQMSNVDVQYMELRQFQIPEIARFWRMPLHKIQDMSASTNNNIEQMALEFLSDCMMPWFVRWEQSLNMQLLTVDEQKEYFFKFDVDEILRADMKSRFEAYGSAITNEIFNPNECREKEDMNPYIGGEKYMNRNTKAAPPAGGLNEKKPMV